MNVIRFIARRYLFSRKQISLISILTGISIAGITIGTALLIIVLSVFNGFYDVVQGFLLSFDPDIRIEHSEERVLPADSLFMARLASHPDVVRVSPYIEEKAMLMMPYDQADVVTVRGIDPERAVRFNDLMSTVKGRAENPVDGHVESRLESRAGGEVPGENRVEDHVEEVGRGDERTRATSGNKDRSNGIREELGRGDADADWAAGKKSGVTHSVPLRPGNMLINENLNLKYGVQTGDAVALIGADGLRRSVTRLSPPRMQRFDVTGIYEMRQILEGDRVYIDLLSAQQVFRMPREVSGYELELRRPDDAERVREELLKRFEMCFANVRHYRNVWLRDRTELRNIAGISRAHLQNQHLMRGLQIVVDDFADPHRRVETPRRGADLIPLPQQGIDHKFGAGFAITPGDGNHFQVRKAGKFLPCLSFKALLDLFFHGFYQPASEQQQQRSNHIYQQQHKR